MWPAINHLFEQSDCQGNTLVFKCILCLPKHKSIKASVTSASNLRTHIKSIHPSKLNEFNKNIERGRKRKIYSNVEVEDEEPKTKQIKPNQLLSSEYQSPEKTNQVHNAVLRFVVGTGSAFSVVEHPDFINFLKVCSNGNSSSVPPNRKQLMIKMEDSFNEMKNNLKETLKDVSTVCTTADCWTVFKRSYLGMTVHWLDKVTLERKSKGLSCRRIIGSHTYKIIADAIEGILNEFEIKNKTSVIITDNGSNFLKAFRVFGCLNSNDNAEIDDATEEIQLEEAIDVASILDTNEDFGRLPPHQRCTSHNLNLLSASASEEAVSNSAIYRKICCQVFFKCQALFNKQNKSPVAGDTIKKHLGRYLLEPGATIWNSFFDAVQLLTTKEVFLDALCNDLDLPTFKRPQEITFLEEYCKVMEPVASALDILQEDKHMYMGYLLPILSVVKSKLSSITNLQYCNPLKEALCSGFEKRFSKYFKQRELKIGAALIPRFKLDWVSDEEKLVLKKEVLNEFAKLTQDSKPVSEIPIDSALQKLTKVDKFFATIKQDSAEKKSIAESLLSCYLLETDEIAKIPKIAKEIFIKFNTGIPSSAGCERLFSASGLILNDRRCKMLDKHFEMQLLLRFNNFFFTYE